MDIDLIRTFLEVINTGSFIGAAPRLNVTQSTVSARIKLLEDQIGAPLFVRNKNGAGLTPAGTHFQRAAITLVRIWEQARQDAALPQGYTERLRIGGEAGLWNRWLHRWIMWMRQHAPTIALHCEAGMREGMVEALLEGVLDIAVMFSPQVRPSLKVELLAEDELVLLEADPPGGITHPGEHIFVDWGEEFRRMHDLKFPDFPNPALSIGLGTLGFDHLLRVGGTGYFPKALAGAHLDSGAVRIVPGESSFLLPVYAVYAVDAASAAIEPALTGIRAILAGEAELAAPRLRPHAAAATLAGKTRAQPGLQASQHDG